MRTDYATLDNIAARLNRTVDTSSVRDIDDAMRETDAQLALYGVESLTFNCTVYPSILYVNAGDPYVATICYDTNAAEFVAAGWGDVLEYHESECPFCRGEDDGTDGEDE